MNRDTRPIFLGDSITAARAIASAARNAGVPGQTPQQIAARAAAEINVGFPAYVHIQAGTVGLPADPTDAVAAIVSMIDMAKSRSIPVIVGLIPPYDPVLYSWEAQHVPAYNNALWAASTASGAIMVDYFSPLCLSSGLQNGALFQDGIHPNAAGYSLMDTALALKIAVLPPAPQPPPLSVDEKLSLIQLTLAELRAALGL